MKTSAAAALILSLGLIHTAQATEVTVNASNLGWYQSTGAHTDYNDNTLTGYLSSTEYRSFYIWDLPQLNGVVTGARIDFTMPYSLGASGLSSQTGSMFDVEKANIPYLGQNNGGGHGVDIFNDLGSGKFYGNITVASSYYYSDYTFSVALNAEAIAGINGASGEQFALGMKNNTLSIYDYFLLSSMSTRGAQNLVLTVSPVPEPGHLALLAGGMLVAVFSLKRQRG